MLKGHEECMKCDKFSLKEAKLHTQRKGERVSFFSRWDLFCPNIIRCPAVVDWCLWVRWYGSLELVVSLHSQSLLVHRLEIVSAQSMLSTRELADHNLLLFAGYQYFRPQPKFPIWAQRLCSSSALHTSHHSTDERGQYRTHIISFFVDTWVRWNIVWDTHMCHSTFLPWLSSLLFASSAQCWPLGRLRKERDWKKRKVTKVSLVAFVGSELLGLESALSSPPFPLLSSHSPLWNDSHRERKRERERPHKQSINDTNTKYGTSTQHRN